MAWGGLIGNRKVAALAPPLTLILRSHFPSLGLSFLVWKMESLYRPEEAAAAEEAEAQGERPPVRPGTHRGVGPPAHAAAVGLGVLDGVGGQVDLQGGGVRVGAVAVGTLVGLVLVVLTLVRLKEQRRESGASRPPPALPPSYAPFSGRQLLHQVGGRQVATHLEVGELSESLFTARMRALVGSVACVDSAMGSPVRWGP